MARRKSASPQLRASAGSLFGAVVRQTRENKGLSQGELAKLVPCSRPQLTRIESGIRVPSEVTVRKFDEVLGTGGQLLKLWGEVDWYVPVEHPDWFQRYVRLEAEATSIQEYETNWISGLLQTESFMRALFAGGDAAGNPELIEERVAARLSRQRRLFEGDPPLLVVLLGEAALRQVTGSPEIMYEQLQHLLTMSRRPNVAIQVVSFNHSRPLPLFRSMTLVTSSDGMRRIYSESLERGHFIEDPKEVQEKERAYDLLRAHALSVRESEQLIRSISKGLLNMSTSDLSNTPWRKSSYSGGEGGQCIEVADGFAGVLPVRDSKDPHGPALVFPAASWSAFVDGIKAGDFPEA